MIFGKDGKVGAFLRRGGDELARFAEIEFRFERLPARGVISNGGRARASRIVPWDGAE